MGIQWVSASAIYNLKKACDSVRREAFYNIRIQFGISLILVRLITVCSNETYSRPE
jgi:hypothetical protein